MKIDLQDVTFLILVKLDSVERLENLRITTDYLYRYFKTNIWVMEVAGYNSELVRRVLNKKVSYQFIEDKNPILYRTKYYNRMICTANTPIIAIWDADILAENKTIEEAIRLLRVKEADVVYPYNGKFLETSSIIKELYVRNGTFSTLIRNSNKMNLLYDKVMYGGAVFFDKEKFIRIGMENETYYGWGDEDFDRYVRSQTLVLKIMRTDNVLYHLSHPRGINSKYRSNFQRKVSSGTLQNVINSSREELIRDLSLDIDF